jgi:REP element-mobilizing transposase RayT
MSGRPRSQVIDETKVGVYHVWNRCIRKMYLFGADRYSGRDYTSRKALLQQRLQELSAIFAVDACVWAMLSNHFHLIVRNRPDLAQQYSDEEVAIRWWYLYPERRDEQGRPAPPTPVEIRSIVETPGRIEVLRKRLSSISWFMKSLEEWLAKRINAMDKHRGHLWQDRYGCRNLLTEGAILVCSIYIDINEIQAGLAACPADSRNTSAYLRILAQILRRERAAAEADEGAPPRIQLDYQFSDPDIWLCPLDTQDRSPLLSVPGTATANQPWDPQELEKLEAASVAKRWRHGFLPVTVEQYLEILERSVGALAAESREAVEQWLAPVLEPLGIRVEAWFAMLAHFETWLLGLKVFETQSLELHETA